MSRPPPGELLLLGFEGTSAPAWLLERIGEGRCGGVVLFARNLGSPLEVAALVRSLHEETPPDAPPLVVAIDQEGGRVQRMKAPLVHWPPMGRVGAMGDAALTEAVGRALGDELRLLGINLDFAPVCDVLTNPGNPVIGDRAFGTTPEAVALHAAAFLRGLEAAGVRGCIKHFPGHGDTSQDSHLDLPRVDHPMERLRAVELPPFAKLVAAGARMVMTAHVVVAALDERPATMSRAWIDGVLRGELGFSGVVVSDDLDMKAVAGRFPVEQVVGEALGAGVDCFLLCRDPERQREAEEALVRAASDRVLGWRMSAAQSRMRAFRATLSRPVPRSDEEIAAALPDAAHQALAASIRGGPSVS